MLKCPDNINVVLQVYKKSSAEIMHACLQNHSNHNEQDIISNEIFLPFQFVPVRVKI